MAAHIKYWIFMTFIHLQVTHTIFFINYCTRQRNCVESAMLSRRNHKMRGRDVFIYTDLRELPQGNHYALTFIYTLSGKFYFMN